MIFHGNPRHRVPTTDPRFSKPVPTLVTLGQRSLGVMGHPSLTDSLLAAVAGGLASVERSDLDDVVDQVEMVLHEPGGRFAIDSITGVVTVANGAAIDFETAAGHAYGLPGSSPQCFHWLKETRQSRAYTTMPTTTRRNPIARMSLFISTSSGQHSSPRQGGSRKRKRATPCGIAPFRGLASGVSDGRNCLKPDTGKPTECCH